MKAECKSEKVTRNVVDAAPRNFIAYWQTERCDNGLLTAVGTSVEQRILDVLRIKASKPLPSGKLTLLLLWKFNFFNG